MSITERVVQRLYRILLEKESVYVSLSKSELAELDSVAINYVLDMKKDIQQIKEEIAYFLISGTLSLNLFYR